MRAALIAVGSELLHAGRRDSNGDWLGDRLQRSGVSVALRVQVGDDPAEIAEQVRCAAARCEWVLVTGGLGPTEDDRTREAIALAVGDPLVRDADVEAALRRRFEERGRPYRAHQGRQAERPGTARWLPNPTGTAPGFAVRCGEAQVVALPGVPSEMRSMFDRGVAPELRASAAGSGLRRRTIKVSGRLESSVDRQIRDLYGREGVTVTILAGVTGIELHVVAVGDGPGQAESRLQASVEEIRARLDDDVYGYDEDTLASSAGRMLRERGLTVATAESCTAGLLSGALTEVPGSSAWFIGGVVVYRDDLKVRLAGIDPDVLARHGAVSPEVAVELARGARRTAGADVGVGLTGVAGPGGGTVAKPVGTVHLAIHDDDGAHCESFRFPGDRAAVRGRTVAWALDRIRRRFAKG